MVGITGLDVDLYLRKSRKDIEEEKKAEKQGQSYDTLARHRRQLLAIANKENYNIKEIHEEIVSGESIFDRPAIQELIRRIENQEIDAVLVIDIDRLGRGDMLDQGILDRAFRYSGTKLITVNEIYDPEDESWELVFSIKSLVARQELKAINRRLQGGRTDSVIEGKSISKRPPYGYLRNENLKLYPDPEKAWVVKKIFEMMKNGEGRQAVAQELDRLEITPPDKERKNWSPSTVTSIVKNEVYLGHIIWGKLKYTKREGKYTRTKVPKEKWKIAKNAHTPIISEELFAAANQAHSGRFRPHTTSTNTLSNPLAGILKCKLCGFTMLYQPRKDRPNDVIRCTQPACKGIQKAASLDLVEQRLLDSLEQYVNEFHVNVESNRENFEEEIPIKLNAIKVKEKEFKELSEQKNNLHDLLERKVYSIETFLERENNLSERIKKIEKEISVLTNEVEIDLMKNKKIKDIIPTIQKVIEAYKDIDDIKKKNELLKSVLEKATYLRKKEWKQKDKFEIQLFLKI